MDLMMQQQIEIELKYSKKHVDIAIDKFYRETEEVEQAIQRGIGLLQDWLGKKDTYYASKYARLRQLDELSLEQMVRDVLVNVAYYRKPELFVSVTAQLARAVGFSDHKDSIVTMAEIVTILSMLGAYELYKPTEYSSLYLVSNLNLPAELIERMEQSQYLPPMICPPKEVKDNWEGGYLTQNEPVVLGKGNVHDGEMALDVINIQNSIPMQLDQEFLNSVEERPTKPLKDAEQMNDWKVFLAQSKKVYELLISHGNRFWFTHKYDKRGRLYSQGYHVAVQGSPYKRAALSLADEYTIDVPEEYQL